MTAPPDPRSLADVVKQLDPREPTTAQLDACKHAKLDPAAGDWHGDVLVIPYWSGEDLYALVNEHGSITYCAGVMLDAHKAGIPT